MSLFSLFLAGLFVLLLYRVHLFLETIPHWPPDPSTLPEDLAPDDTREASDSLQFSLPYADFSRYEWETDPRKMN